MSAVNPSIWRVPDLSARWWPVFLRNLLVWKKLAIPSLVGNIAEPLMWLVAFGYGMGALVGQVTVQSQAGATQVPYILFLASGSICMSAMNAATFEALYSAYSRMACTEDLGRHHERPGERSTTSSSPRCCGRRLQVACFRSARSSA
jgi:lipooligosaccharide transport system permease protein